MKTGPGIVFSRVSKMNRKNHERVSCPRRVSCTQNFAASCMTSFSRQKKQLKSKNQKHTIVCGEGKRRHEFA